MRTSGKQGEADAGADLERLRHRRQFFLGPRFLDERPGWARLKVDPRLFLSVHPDLPVTRVEAGARSIVLLGFALDPERPDANDTEVLHSLLARSTTCDGIVEDSGRLGGRWAMIVDDGVDRILFHDAAGQRQVLHAIHPATSSVVAASQTALVAAELQLSKDASAVDFVRARGGNEGSVYWMPGSRTTYREIRALLPNHLLDLTTGRVRRYWPRPGWSCPASADPRGETTRLLRGMLAAARRRFPLALPMTAGWDSRLMLALCRDVGPGLYCFTVLGPSTPPDDPDVTVPSRLLGSLGFPHHVLAYPDAIDAGLRAVFVESTDPARDTYCADIQALHSAFPGERVCVTGDVAEVVKRIYHSPRRRERAVSAEDLARLSQIGDFPFAIQAFQEWLDGALPEGIDLLDLFCWEQMAGRWQALVRAEYDTVQECVAPLNCRNVLLTMLDVDPRERRSPEYAFLRRILLDLWPDVLREPVNPRRPRTARQVVGGILRRLHLYDRIPPRLLGRRARVVPR